MAMILIILPLFGKHVNYSGMGWSIPFAVFIGLGFIFLEIGMIHRMTLHLGHPYHAFALTVSVLLVSSGIGSRLYGHRIRNKRTLGFLTLFIALVIFLDGILTRSFLLELFARKPTWRLVFAGIFVAATGFIMGIPFPSLLRFVQERGKGMGNVPWTWSINGGATVVGSTLAALMALELGIQMVFVSAVVCYALAGLCAAATRSSRIINMDTLIK
jgi:hypothetical protein